MSNHRELKSVIDFLEQYGIKSEEICAIGGLVLQLNNIRKANDYDFMVSNESFKKLLGLFGLNKSCKFIEIPYKSTKIDIKKDQYKHIGYSDYTLFNRSDLLESIAGFKTIRLEIEFARLVHRKYPTKKVDNDITKIEKEIAGNENWNWNLIPVRAYHSRKNSTLLMRARRKLSSLIKIKKEYYANKLTPVMQQIDLGILIQYMFIKNINSLYKVNHEIDALKKLELGQLNKAYFSNYIDICLDNNVALFYNKFNGIDKKSGQELVGLKLYKRDFTIRLKNKLVPELTKKHSANSPIKFERKLNNLLIQSGACYSCIIWEPAHDQEELICNIISEYGTIIGKTNKVSLINFDSFIHDIYKSDDVESWKIKKKAYHISKFGKMISIVHFMLPNFNYRMKGSSDSPIDVNVEKLKSELRNSVKPNIKNYIHDIALHIGDNPTMNREINKVFTEYGISYDY